MDLDVNTVQLINLILEAEELLHSYKIGIEELNTEDCSALCDKYNKLIEDFLSNVNIYLAQRDVYISLDEFTL